MRSRIKDIHFNTRLKWGIRAASKKGIYKADESGVSVAGALRSQGKKDILWVCVVLRVVGMFLVASNLRMSCRKHAGMKRQNHQREDDGGSQKRQQQ
jgi:hypothetical protein